MKNIKLTYFGILLACFLVSCGGGGSGGNSGSNTPEPQLAYPDLTVPRLLNNIELATPSPPSSVQPPSAVEAQWLKDNHYPIRSLVFDKDFSDLEFLKKELNGKRIVQLGESSHGVKEFNLVKVRMIKYMHEHLGYNVLAFESGMMSCYRQNSEMATTSLTPKQMITQCIFGVWQTEELEELFRYIKSTHSTERPLKITGFDIQISGAADRMQDIISWLLPLTNAIEPQSNDQVNLLLSKITQALGNSNERLENFIIETAQPIISILKKGANTSNLKVRSEYEAAILVFSMLQARLDNQFEYARNPLNQMKREKGMADTLSTLAEKVYPEDKIIVWAHNAHIATKVQYYASISPTGEYLKSRWGDQLHTVGIFMLRGTNVTEFVSKKVENVKSPIRGSLEELSYSLRLGASYIPIEKSNHVSSGDDWQHRIIPFRSWGIIDHSGVLSENYNAVIMIDRATLPKYSN